MTNDEQRDLANNVLGDLARAERRLKCLQVKAERLACDIVLVVRALKGEKVGHQDGAGFRVYDAPDGVALDRAVSWPSADDIGAVLKEIEAARREVIDLTNQKQSIGF